jgi:hypothetical protein
VVARILLALPVALFLPALAFPLHGQEFSTLVQDSYREVRGAPAFLPWLQGAYARAFGASLERALKEEGRRGGLEAARFAFLLVKRLLPRFSLEEGYEFAYAALKGERQCLLQAVLVQGFLQEMGYEAGVYMVWRNPEGRESKLGHAVAVLRLKGRDYLVDPSEPEPFARHRGLFLDTAAGYRFVEPVYTDGGGIVGYRFQGRVLRPEEVRPLPFAFLRSQFYYYRGEQAKGGVFAKPSTRLGLERSLGMLERAVALDPKNPLALYVLGLTKRKLHRGGQAELEAAFRLYQAFGHVPEGPRRALGLP